MSIRSLLSGIKPRTKTFKLTDEKSVILHELSTSTRIQIERERAALSEKDEVSSQEYNESAATIVAMSILDNGKQPTKDDIDALLEMLGVDQLDALFTAVLTFNAMDEVGSEEARKN